MLFNKETVVDPVDMKVRQFFASERTVTVHIDHLMPISAVIVAMPGATARIIPSELTSATPLLEVLHLIVCSVASVGRIRADKAIDSPTLRVTVLGSIVKEETGITFLLIVTIQLTVTSSADAVIMDVPSETAVMVPLESIVATEVLSEDHVIVGFVASEGIMVAVSEYCSPSVSVKSCWLNTMDVTGTTTVTMQVAVKSPAEAMIVAFPPAIAVITPC